MKIQNWYITHWKYYGTNWFFDKWMNASIEIKMKENMKKNEQHQYNSHVNDWVILYALCELDHTMLWALEMKLYYYASNVHKKHYGTISNTDCVSKYLVHFPKFYPFFSVLTKYIWPLNFGFHSLDSIFSTLRILWLHWVVEIRVLELMRWMNWHFIMHFGT